MRGARGPRDAGLRRGLELAGPGPGAADVLVRLGSVCGGAAPWHRHRRACGDARACACRRHDLLRRHRPDRWQDGDDPDRGRVRGHPRPPRIDRGRARRAGGGAGSGRHGRPERRPGARRAVCLPRHPAKRRSAGLPRSAPLLAGPPRGSGRAAGPERARAAGCIRSGRGATSCRHGLRGGRARRAGACDTTAGHDRRGFTGSGRQRPTVFDGRHGRPWLDHDGAGVDGGRGAGRIRARTLRHAGPGSRGGARHGARLQSPFAQRRGRRPA